MKKLTCVSILYGGAFLLFIPLIAAPITLSYSSRENTLATLPDWGASKVRLAMELMGAESYVTGTQALAGNRLNLDAWHGYQEVMYRHAVTPAHVRFRFYVDDNAYICLVFNRPRPFMYRSGKYHALRLSTMPEKPSALLHVDAKGAFLQRTPVETRDMLRPQEWNTCSLVWDDANNRIDVFLNGQSVGAFPGDFGGTQYIGFRGGVHPARVDMVRIHEKDGGRYATSFSWHEGNNRRLLMRSMTANTLKTALAVVVLLLLSRLVARNCRSAAAATLSCCATAAITLWPWALFINPMVVTRYPEVDEHLLNIERAHVEERMRMAVKEIQASFPLEEAYPTNTIIAIGSSQTWGCGAAVREHTWTAQLENILNERNTSSGHVVINGGVQGVQSKELADLYETFLRHYPHTLVVIVLGCNDLEPVVFRENLERLILLAREAHAQPLLAVEPLSYEEAPEGVEERWVLASVAEALDVPIFDLHKALEPCQDAGFFWWDVVHPTSFGHARIANALAPFVLEHLQTGDTGIPVNTN